MHTHIPSIFKGISPYRMLYKKRRKIFNSHNRTFKNFGIFYNFTETINFCIVRLYAFVTFILQTSRVPLYSLCDTVWSCHNSSRHSAMCSFPFLSSLETSKYTHQIWLCVVLLLCPSILADQNSAPHFVMQPTSVGGLVTEHQSKILQCEAVGFPLPVYRWFHNDKPLGNFTQDPHLRIPRIIKEDSGQYHCMAHNAIGTLFSEKISLTVAFIEEMFSKENTSQTVENGQAAVLRPPSVISVPHPTVSWQKIGQGRLHGIKYATSLDNALVILATSTADQGSYKAFLTNSQAGKEVHGGISELIVSGLDSDSIIFPKIIIPPKNSVFMQGAYPATLECISNARPLDAVFTLWKKDGRDMSSTGLSHFLSPWNRSLSLLNVGPSHEGFYECHVSMQDVEGSSVKATANVTVLVNPKILQALPRETVSELGKILILPCNASGIPSPVITWYHNAVSVKAKSDGRFHFLSDGSLEISELASTDTGIYQCIAENNAGVASTNTWLHVKSSAPSFVRTPRNKTVLDGKDAQIPCEASGAPTPNVTWIFNDMMEVHPTGRIQILDSGNLLITSVGPNDVGKYSCTRENAAGSITAFAFLNVLVKTQIIQPPVDTQVILSSTAELQCKVSHDPSVTVKTHWYFMSREIIPHEGGRIKIISDGSLRIGQARNTDVGVYTCKVTSAGGNETRSARLDVIELPYSPINVKAILRNTFPKSINVSWSKAFDGNSPITNYVVQMRVASTSESSLEYLLPWITVRANISGNQRYVVLTNLKPAASYEFRVSAVNGVGEGNPSSPSNVIHLPSEPPGGPPQGVVGVARSSTSIMLQWQPPSEEDRNGELLGYMIRYKLAGYSASPWAYHNITTEIQHSFLLQDLIVWQNYEIQVAAYNEKGVGIYSKSIYVRTREGVPQTAPTDVKASPFNSTAISVWWKPPDPQLINGINLGYKLQAWLKEPEETDSAAVTVLVAPSPLDPFAEQVFTLSGLDKYTTYYVTVLCFTNPGDGPRSKPIIVTTEQDVPDKVGSLKFQDILDTSVQVLWDPPVRTNGILTGYTLKYYVKDDPEISVVKNISADATSVTVTYLKPVTAYTFEIYAWTAVGTGVSRTATFQSGIPPVLPTAPTKLAVSNIGAFSIVLQFTPGFDGNTSITKWTVEAQTKRNESWFKIYEVTDPDATNIQVHNLIPFTEYRLRLLASNVVGDSEPSESTKFFQTIQAPPPHPPYNMTIRAVNAKALRVRWTPLQQAEWYGIPRGYNIQYREIDAEENMLKNITYLSVILEDHNANSYVIKDLEEYTDFEVFVQAFNDVGSSPPSLKAIEKTREAVPSAGPSNVTVEATSSTTIVVKWEEVEKRHQNGIIEGYKIYYGAKTIPVQHKTIENNSTFTTTLTELRKYTLYSIQVLAFSRIGDGILSTPPVSVRTFEDVPGMPSNVSFPDVSTTTARILWDVPENPNGEILAYRLSYRQNSSTVIALIKDLAPTERTFKAIDLVPETYYLFSIAAKTNEGWGKAANALVYTTNNREAPQPPSVPYISKSQIQARQITFNWTPGRDGFAPLRFYTIQLAEEKGSWKDVMLKLDPALSTYTVTGLKPSTGYKFRIRATNDIGASDWSPESNITITLRAAPEYPPQQVIVTPYTPTSVRVSWDSLKLSDWNGDVQSAGYRVEYCLTTMYSMVRNVNCPSKKVFGRNMSVLSLDGLERNKIYEIKVYAFNEQGDGPPSRPVPVFVGEAVPTGKPLDITAEATSSTEVIVRWKPPLLHLQNGGLLGYKIFYEPKNGNGIEEMEAVPPATTSYVLLDLKKYTEYGIQILAFNPAGDGPRSTTQYVQTLEDIPGPPGPLVFSDITMTSLNVSWLPPAEPNGKITGYLVTYETAFPNSDFSKQVTQKVVTTFLSVHNLGEIVTYTFKVCAKTFDHGPETVSNVTTGPQEGSPSSPENLILQQTHTSVILHWRNGAEGMAPIYGYLIEFRQADSTGHWQTLASLNSSLQTSFAVSFRDLLLSTLYQFRLFARNSYGISYPAVSSQTFATPSKLYVEHRHKLPFYREVWFLVMLAAVSIIIVVLVVSILCVKSKVYDYKKKTQKSMHEDHMSVDDGGFATFELRQSKRGTLCKNSLSRKNNNTVLTKSPPRPSPGSVTYSDDDDVKGYDENCDSSSLTEKPSEMSSSDSQGSDSEHESDGKSEPHSFVNHYANVNDTLRQSWKRQRPVKPPSYTDSEPEGSIQVSLNGGQIIMNNMAGSRAPLPGFSSFV